MAVLRLSMIGVVALAAVCLTTSAFAFGALAVGEPADVAKDGLAMGWSADLGSQDAASAEALDWCHKINDPPVSEETRALCKVVLTFTHQCFAVAFDKKPKTPGRGWAIAATKEEAAAAALEKCKSTAGAGREGFCEIALNDCDVVP